MWFLEKRSGIVSGFIANTSGPGAAANMSAATARANAEPSAARRIVSRAVESGGAGVCSAATIVGRTKAIEEMTSAVVRTDARVRIGGDTTLSMRCAARISQGARARRSVDQDRRAGRRTGIDGV